MKVKDLMVEPVIVVSESASLEEAARTMLEKCIGCLPVVDERGEISGIITESDFTAKEKGIPFSTFRAPQLFGQWMDEEGIERIYSAARKMTAREIMRRNVVTVSEDDSVAAVLDRMLRHNITRIPVVRDKTPVGMVARHDLLKLMAHSKEMLSSTKAL
ncbi:MAG TPA: CBS domain-containing protein [Blastocatellia bacterium]|nr:CBS domain-containing protein [Blastocatellia bacterium]